MVFGHIEADSRHIGFVSEGVQRADDHVEHTFHKEARSGKPLHGAETVHGIMVRDFDARAIARTHASAIELVVVELLHRVLFSTGAPLLLAVCSANANGTG
jgi:hypothetical protein